MRTARRSLVRLQPRPNRIERDEPWNEIGFQPVRVRASQRLVEMMMRVDEAGKNDVARLRRKSRRREPGIFPRPTSSTMRVPSTTSPRSPPSARMASGSLIQSRMRGRFPVVYRRREPSANDSMDHIRNRPKRSRVRTTRDSGSACAEQFGLTSGGDRGRRPCSRIAACRPSCSRWSA